MDKKQEIINEYLISKAGYRILSKKYGVSRSAINRWVMDFKGRQRKSSNFRWLLGKDEERNFYQPGKLKKNHSSYIYTTSERLSAR